jgi:hypothetical protein
MSILTRQLGAVTFGSLLFLRKKRSNATICLAQFTVQSGSTQQFESDSTLHSLYMHLPCTQYRVGTTSGQQDLARNIATCLEWSIDEQLKLFIQTNNPLNAVYIVERT